MKLEVFTLKDKKAWDNIVSLFPSADVYYLSGYAETFQAHGDGQPLLFYFYEEGSACKAINVVMKRDISKDVHFATKIEQNRYFDIVTPYGYGGILCNNLGQQSEFLKKVEDVYVEYCNEKNIISEFVRFHPLIGNGVKSISLYDVVQVGETIWMDITNKETIWSNLTSKNRNVIRKAQKNGVRIKQELSHKIMEYFIKLYNETMERDHADEYYYFKREFYESIIRDLKEHAMIFYATLEEEIIAAAIILYKGDCIHYHLSASNETYRCLAATNLLLYEAACWGCDRGYKSFHLGGGLGAKEDSLFKFKKAFNRRDHAEFWIGKKIFNLNQYKELMEIRKQDVMFDENTGFFPKYRG